MKKTKPVKGSARAKKFDAGGLAALAGLGALAYMMRKKKEGTGSVPTDTSGYSSSQADVRKMIEGSRDEESRTPSATKFGGESNLGPAITETGTRPGPDTTEPKLERKTASVAKKRVVAPAPSKATEKMATQSFGVDEDALNRRRLEGLSKPKEEAKKPKSKLSDTGKSTRLKALLGSVPGNPFGMKKGGAVKASKMGAVKQAKPSMGSASKRADGIAQRGKTRGRIC